MEKIVKNKNFFFFIFLGILLIAFPVLAKELKLELSWPPSPGPEHIQLTPTTTLPKLVQYFYEWGIALGGLAVFIALIIAGFQYLTSVGEPAKMKEARDRIKSALFGLVLLLSSWLILNTINPQLTVLRLPPNPVGKASQLECDTDTNCPNGYVCSDPNTCDTDEDCKCVDDPTSNDGKKEGHCGEGTQWCDVKIDCGKCVGDLEPDNGVKEGNCSDGKKEGACIKRKEKKKICEGAYVKCADLEDPVWISPGEAIVCKAPEYVKTYIEEDEIKISCCDDKASKEGYYSCGCFLQVFAGSPWYAFWSTCGNMEAIVPGCEKNIVDYTDKAIYCVKLIKSPVLEF